MLMLMLVSDKFWLSTYWNIHCHLTFYALLFAFLLAKICANQYIDLKAMIKIIHASEIKKKNIPMIALTWKLTSLQIPWLNSTTSDQFKHLIKNAIENYWSPSTSALTKRGSFTSLSNTYVATYSSIHPSIHPALSTTSKIPTEFQPINRGWLAFVCCCCCHLLV